MKAVVMTAVGGPEVLQLQEVDRPSIREAGQILVRIKAAGVNPLDTKLRSRGTYFPERMPAILGCDGAGVVEEVGESVEGFRVGDAVYFCHCGLGGEPGTYAEYAVVDERYAAQKPDALDFVQAAAVPLVLITAWESLYDRVHLKEGQRVLVHGGSGGVGHMAVQLARLAGAHVAATVGSEEKASFVEALGVEHPILYRREDFVEAVRRWHPQGVDVALDTVGGEVFFRTLEAVGFYGDLVTLLEPPQGSFKEARLRNLRLAFELMLTPMLYDLPEARRHQTEILEQGRRWFDEGKLTVHVHRTFPLEEAALAHRLLEEGGVMGKLVLVT